MTKIVKRTVSEQHGSSGPEVSFPVAEFSGRRDGPSIAVTAGMHGGEYAGVHAAGKLIERLEHETVLGRVVVIPILSVQAFYGRSMQLSPVDEREVHYQSPNGTDGSYSEHLVDLLVRTIGTVDAFVDLHAGEFAQDLVPHVAVPWLADDATWDRSLDLANAYDVAFVVRREVRETPLALPLLLLERGIPNIWTEIGRNGLPEASAIDLQYSGTLQALRNVGAIEGPRAVHAPPLVGPKHWGVFAEESGVWLPSVHSGESVRAGQIIGSMRDAFGATIHEYASPGSGLVKWICTSAAINLDRQPHGYKWHSFLGQIVEDDSSVDDRLQRAPSASR